MELMSFLVAALRQLRDFQVTFIAKGQDRCSTLEKPTIETFNRILEFAKTQFKDFELDAAIDRIRHIEITIKADCPIEDLVKELDVLCEVAEDQLTRRHSVYVLLKKHEFFQDSRCVS